MKMSRSGSEHGAARTIAPHVPARTESLPRAFPRWHWLSSRSPGPLMGLIDTVEPFIRRELERRTG